MPLTTGVIASARNKHIEFSDIPELDDAFWRDAELVEPDTTEQVTMRLKRSVLDFFKETGKGLSDEN